VERIDHYIKVRLIKVSCENLALSSVALPLCATDGVQGGRLVFSAYLPCWKRTSSLTSMLGEENTKDFLNTFINYV
jgi:hypothetical protein